MGIKTLIVEDEAEVQKLLRDVLQGAGHEVLSATSGREGLRAFYAYQPSLVVLDVRMPEMDGWSVLQRIREVSNVPVIMVTALGQEEDKVRGLKGGANDYIVKPISTAEFAARVEAILRNVNLSPEALTEYKDSVLRVDFSHHRVYVRGNDVMLTPQEFRLLAAFVRNPNIVMSVDRLLDSCWGEGDGGPENLRVYIGYLRKKLEANPKEPKLIETVREFGYRYHPPSS